MIIYAKDDEIILQCRTCTYSERIHGQTVKRSFVARMNKFNRSHAWGCKIEKERSERRLAVKATTDSIIEKLQHSAKERV